VEGVGAGLGLGWNLSTLAPLLTLAWHVFTLLPSLHIAPPWSSAYYRSRPRPASSPPPGTPDRLWPPHALALLWLLATVLTLAVPPWTADTAVSHACLAVLSVFEAGVLALVQYHVLRELDGGEVDGECGWDEGDEMKLSLM
jgi:hypothetical protein